MSQSIPTQHVAGDSFAATLDGSARSAADGWVAQLVLIGAARHTLASSASGSDHAVAVAAATTAAWVAGDYALRALYTRGAERQSVDVGTLRVLPDPAASGTDAAALKSGAQQALDALRAAYREYISSGSFKVASYMVQGHTMTYRTVPELLQAINAAEREVEAEQAAARIAAGLSPRARFVVRM